MSSRGVPAFAVVFSAALATVLVLVQAASAPGFAAFYSLVVGLSTMTAVIPYAFCALAGGLVAAHVAGGGPAPRVTAVEIIAFLFSVFTLYGCGAEAVLYGLLLLIAGIPIFVWQRYEHPIAKPLAHAVAASSPERYIMTIPAQRYSDSHLRRLGVIVTIVSSARGRIAGARVRHRRRTRPSMTAWES